MNTSRWFDTNDHTLRSFIISLSLAISLGGLAVIGLFNIQLTGWVDEVCRVVFGLGAVGHLIALITNKERWDESFDMWDLAYGLSPLIAVLLVSLNRPTTLPGYALLAAVATVTGVCAIVWWRMGRQIFQFGADHGFQPVVEEFE